MTDVLEDTDNGDYWNAIDKDHEGSERESIFIIDEVDVLLCDKITKTHNMSSAPCVNMVAQLQKDIYRYVLNDEDWDPSEPKRKFIKDLDGPY